MSDRAERRRQGKARRKEESTGKALPPSTTRGIQDPSPLEQAQKAFLKLTPTDQATFRAWEKTV